MILILQQSKDTPPGSTIQWCQQNQIPFRLIRMDLEIDQLPQNLTYKDGVIICGGGLNVDEEHLHPWLTIEKEFLRTCLKNKIPLLGLCLGGQLLAEALGARVSKHPHWEVGWTQISIQPHLLLQELTKQNTLPLQASVLETLKQNTLQVFQWHGYSFDTPTNALQFATNECCKHQGFIFENFAIGLQFHPEATSEWILENANTPEKNYPTGTFVQSKSQILAHLENQSHLQKWYFALLDGLFKPRIIRD